MIRSLRQLAFDLLVFLIVALMATVALALITHSIQEAAIHG